MISPTGLTMCLASAAVVVSCTAALAQTIEAGAVADARNITIVEGGGSGGGGSQTVHTTPDAIAPSIIPSAPCIAVFGSLGLSTTGFGLSLGSGVTDQVCQGGNLAAVAAGVHQSTGSDHARQVADIALGRALALYMDASAPADPSSASGFHARSALPWED